MKKTIKISLFIIMIISLFAVSASAQNKTIEWDDGIYTETYNYGGELKLGSNYVSYDKKLNIFDKEYSLFENVYYEFDVEQSGYYNINTLSDGFYSTYISQDIKDSVVYGDKEYFIFDDDGFKIYLEEGRCIFGVIFYSYNWSVFDNTYVGEINIEFIAEEITDLQIKDEYLEDIILGYHIGTDYDEENTGSIYAAGKITFSNGKELEFSQWLGVEYDENIASGKNEITFVLPNYKKTYTVQINTIDDYIKNIEIGNAEEVAVVKEAFVPDVTYSIEPEYFELIITLPDGTKKTEHIDYYYDIELKGEKLLTIWCEYYQKDDGKWYLTAEVGNKEYLSIPCKTIPASFNENYILYWEGVTEFAFIMLDDTSYYISKAFDMFSGLSIKERINYLQNAFTAIGNYYSEIYKLTEMFIKYIK